MPRVGAFFVASVLLAGTAAAQELNLSQDLLRLVISANMEPNRPDLDSRPLFQAAIEYVRRQSIARVTLDPGEYYFLTTQPNGRYIYLANLHDVAFAFPGVNLYFREAYVGLFAIQIVDSERLTLSGFTVDFLELPFTQVRVAQVQLEARSIRFEDLPGFRRVTDFNDIRTSNGSMPELHGIVFRDGTVVGETGRIAIARPVRADTAVVEAEGYWSDPATLARYLPGDTLVVFGRGAQGTAVRVDGGREVAFEDVDVYASNSIAILFVRVGAARLERVRVLPRPGTGRLISSNADGLNLTNVQAGSVVRDSVVQRTLDDGIAVNSTFLAVIQDAPGASRLTIAGNQVLDSGRAGIWISNVAGGSIRDNVIARHGGRPDLPIVGVPVADRAQLTREFQEAVVVRSSDGVAVSANLFELSP